MSPELGGPEASTLQTASIPQQAVPPFSIRSLRLHPYRLPLRRPWVAASATLTERRGWLLELTDDNGITGWGDCAPLPSSGEAGLARCLAALERLTTTYAAGDNDPPEVRWAFETAHFDIEARQRGLPLARLLGAESLAVPVNAALGPLDDGCAERAGTAIAQGFAIGKIKVGVAPVAEELARLRELAAELVGQLRLRLDANRAWSDRGAERMLTSIADLPIDGVEEPLAAPNCAALARLQATVPFALAVDESLPVLGVDDLLSSRAVRRFVIKPARIGGMTPTLTLAKRAHESGIEVVLTSVIDSTVGVTAAAHLAAALVGTSPGGPAHGLATSGWLAEDVATAPAIENGMLVLSEAPGLGLCPRQGGETPVP